MNKRVARGSVLITASRDIQTPQKQYYSGWPGWLNNRPQQSFEPQLAETDAG